jgi:hypothetical protein
MKTNFLDKNRWLSVQTDIFRVVFGECEPY